VSALDSEKLIAPARIARRDLLKLPVMAAACGLLPGSAVAHAAKPTGPLDEADPEGTKIAIKLTVQHTSDEELLFLKQIGLRWLHADFGDAASYDFIKTTRDRFARYGLTIDCALMEGYRSKRIQLGQSDGTRTSRNSIASSRIAGAWASALRTSISTREIRTPRT
jgi:hypothetical protein